MDNLDSNNTNFSIHQYRKLVLITNTKPTKQSNTVKNTEIILSEVAIDSTQKFTNITTKANTQENIPKSNKLITLHKKPELAKNS